MKEIEKLKEDIIGRYNDKWDTAMKNQEDVLGLVEMCKNNFRLLVENLVSLSYNKGMEEGYRNGYNSGITTTDF